MKYFFFVFLFIAAILMVRGKVKHHAAAVAEPTVSAAEIQQLSVSTSDKVLLVFWQPHCGSCERMEPIVQQVESANPNLQVIRINTRLSENQEVHDQYGVRGTPTFVILQKGKQVGRNNGPFLNKNDFLGFLRTNKSPYSG